jgi:hypothetical protein
LCDRTLNGRDGLSSKLSKLSPGQHSDLINGINVPDNIEKAFNAISQERMQKRKGPWPLTLKAGGMEWHQLEVFRANAQAAYSQSETMRKAHPKLALHFESLTNITRIQASDAEGRVFRISDSQELMKADQANNFIKGRDEEIEHEYRLGDFKKMVETVQVENAKPYMPNEPPWYGVKIEEEMEM